MSPDNPSRDADTRARLALLHLDRMGPARLLWLIGSGDAPGAVESVRRGRFPADAGPPPPGVTRPLLEHWRNQITDTLGRVDAMLAAGQAIGVGILSPLDDDWPFHDDPEPPGLLFTLGDVELLHHPASVAVVGTRRCTGLGRTVAYRLGRDLTLGGATVISGLALGVDGSAHRGALDHGRTVIGVVAGGLDVVYPRANGPLWHEVGRRGLLVSEVPVGRRPDRWRFPARNRLIAGLAQATVVVESHQRGGALSTAEEAARRDRPVMAVPGSVLSSASKGTNGLLVDGAIPIRDAVDVLLFLGHPVPAVLTAPSATAAAVDDPADAAEPDDPPAEGLDTPVDHPDEGSSDPDQGAPGAPAPALQAAPPAGSVPARILAEVATGPVHLDELVGLTGLTVADVLIVVQELQAAGLVELRGSTVNLPQPSQG